MSVLLALKPSWEWFKDHWYWIFLPILIILFPIAYVVGKAAGHEKGDGTLKDILDAQNEERNELDEEDQRHNTAVGQLDEKQEDAIEEHEIQVDKEADKLSRDPNMLSDRLTGLGSRNRSGK